MNWRKIFEERGAIWIHDGESTRPHALLTSGLHSNGFVNGTLITQDPALMAQILSEEGLGPKLPRDRVDWVIGSALGAITMAFAVAMKLKAKAGYTEKEDGKVKLSRFEVLPHERVLVVEDTLSTGTSTLKTIEAIETARPDASSPILPMVICLVNRSGMKKLGSREIRSLLELEIHTWESEHCPLCNEGSVAMRPKKNWQDLTR
jgi:orotate phosphoribosyltransferase